MVVCTLDPDVAEYASIRNQQPVFQIQTLQLLENEWNDWKMLMKDENVEVFG